MPKQIKPIPDSETLADELFRRVEFAQGKAFISDGMGNLTAEEIFKNARIALRYTNKVAKEIRAWLKGYDQPTA